LHPPHERIEDMAKHYISDIRKVQPHGPYRLGGVCLGGIVALEMAHQLRAQGEDVGLVAMIDSYYPGTPPHLVPRVSRGSLTWVADYYLGDILLRSPRERGVYVLTRMVNIARRLGRQIKRLAGIVYPAVVREGTLPRVMKQVQEANRLAEHRYVPRPFDGRITLFWCSELPVRAYQDRRLGWSEIAGDGLEVEVVPGNHMSMVEEPHVSVLAAKLRQALDRSDRQYVRREGAA
jgi:aspartate racemase